MNSINAECTITKAERKEEEKKRTEKVYSVVNGAIGTAKSNIIIANIHT